MSEKFQPPANTNYTMPSAPPGDQAYQQQQQPQQSFYEPPPPYSTVSTAKPPDTPQYYQQQDSRQFAASSYPPPPPVHPSVIIVNSTRVVAFGRHPVQCQCPHCNAYIVTRVCSVPGGLAWLSCFICFLFGFWICCFIPFCCDPMLDLQHRCPECNHLLGTYKRM